MPTLIMNEYEQILADIQSDERYELNLDWGVPRQGHPEGTVRAHITELEQNLERLRSSLSEDEYWKLKVLIHTHDTFKAESKRGVPIAHPQSHASIAREVLADYCNDDDMLTMVQYHDEPYALWRKNDSKGALDKKRLDDLLRSVQDWNLFTTFLIIDGYTEGKSREPLRWFFEQIQDRVETRITPADFE